MHLVQSGGQGVLPRLLHPAAASVGRGDGSANQERTGLRGWILILAWMAGLHAGNLQTNAHTHQQRHRSFHRYPAVDGALNSHHHCRDLLAVKADVDSPSPVSRASLLNGI